MQPQKLYATVPNVLFDLTLHLLYSHAFPEGKSFKYKFLSMLLALN